MKLKSILTTTVLCAITAQSVSPASFAAEAGAAAEAPASALSVLADANSGILPQISYAENGSVAAIDGAVSGKSVNNESDAAAVLRSIAGLLGVKDFDGELVFIDESESACNATYTFQQVYRGIRVSNGYVKLVVDMSSKKADYLTSSFAPDLKLNTTPTISADAAKVLLKETLDTDINCEPELTIFQTEDEVYHLAWRAMTDSADAAIVYLDAENGSVLRQVGVSYALPASTEQMYSTSDGKYNPIVHSNRFLITYSIQNGNYYSYDSKRNIYVTQSVYDPSFAMEHYYGYQNRKKQYYYENSLSGLENDILVQNYLGLNQLIANTYQAPSKSQFVQDKYSIGSMYVVQRIYDFYLNNFGWKGTDGKGSALAVNGKFFSNKLGSKGSFASPTGNFLAYFYYGESDSTKKETSAAAWDVAAHEFTHRVSIAKVKWEESSNYSEANAISEAYSDILGEYFENKLQWKFGEDEFRQSGQYSRDLSCSPSSGKAKNPYDDGYYYYNYKTYLNEKSYLSHYNQYIGPHNASTILSHAACLMHKAGLPANLAREIWFTSMDYLNTGADRATFSNSRTAVLTAADKVFSQKSLSSSDKKKYKKNITDAFDAVGITG